MEETVKETQATSIKKNYRFGGKRRSKKQYDKLIKSQRIGRNNKGRKSLSECNVSTNEVAAMGTTESTEVKAQAEGYRFMSPSHLGKSMKCTSCNIYLSFENVQNERRCGQASIFTIRCSNCLLLNNVSTGKTIEMSDGSIKFEINVRAVLGAYHTGIGHSKIRDLFATMNVPTMSQNTFKNLERYLTPIIEKITEKSYEEAVRAERQFTLDNIEKIKKY
ncbi:hypothetical protein PV327_011668, partial [Microctonus hyperodae]